MRWKQIKGRPYEVSTDGAVRNMQTGRALKPWKVRGYLYVRLCSNSQAASFSVHRLVLEAFVGPCPDGYQCDHINRIRDDNRLENLRWVTPKENQANRDLEDIRHPCTKLTEEDVRIIRYLCANKHMFGCTQRTLAGRYGVHYSTVSLVVSGKRRARKCYDK